MVNFDDEEKDETEGGEGGPLSDDLFDEEVDDDDELDGPLGGESEEEYE